MPRFEKKLLFSDSLLLEDSHRVSSSLRQAIRAEPDQYHLIYIDVGEVRKALFHDSP